jgi:hypothetical protein
VYNLNKPYSTTPIFGGRWPRRSPWRGMPGIDVTPSYRFGCTEDPLLLYYCICSSMGAELDKLMPAISNIGTHSCHYVCWRLHGISHAFQPSLPVHAEYIEMSHPGDQATRLPHSAARKIRLLGIYLPDPVSENVQNCVVLLIKPSCAILSNSPGCSHLCNNYKPFRL